MAAMRDEAGIGPVKSLSRARTETRDGAPNLGAKTVYGRPARPTGYLFGMLRGSAGVWIGARAPYGS